MKSFLIIFWKRVEMEGCLPIRLYVTRDRPSSCVKKTFRRYNEEKGNNLIGMPLDSFGGAEGS
jgi:hypothetical protein